MSAIEDQQLAGTVMMVEGSLVTIALVCVLFLSALAESERQQTLVEQGVDEPVAARAVRYRRAEAIGSRPRMG